MYKYYKEIIDTEHYLLQKEVAGISGFVSTGMNPHTQLVGSALKEYIKANKIESLYFYSKMHKSMLAVYPASVYIHVIKALYEKISDSTAGSIEIGGKKFSYILAHKLSFRGVA